MILDGNRSHSFMFDSDRQIDRPIDKGQGSVKHDNKTENFFYIVCLKTMSYVPQQMVNVHGQ